MLQTLDQLIAAQATPVPSRTWTAIPGFLDTEVAAGGSKSTRTKVNSALNGLLRAAGLTAEHAPLDLDWFDRVFPVEGWDPTRMSFSQETYADYRNRVRPVIERMTGAAEEKAALRAAKDGWTELARYLRAVPAFSTGDGPKRLIPITSTLTNAARRAGLQPKDLDQAALRTLHAGARKGEIGSLRRASKLIAELQAADPQIVRWLPQPIAPIEAAPPAHYGVPPHFAEEIERMVEQAARKRYIRAKDIHEYVSEGTRANLRTALRAAVQAFLDTGHLDARANTFAARFEEPEALTDLVGHVARRVEADEITARHATSLIRRLPVILERNGIESALLRELIAEVDELGVTAEKAGMPESAKRLCKALIESRTVRNRFLLAHAAPRRLAQDILNRPRAEARALTKAERRSAIRHGVVALFCAIEIGGAPVRIENVLEMPYGGEGAWIRHKGKGFAVAIPGNHTKNRKPIEFVMQPDPHRFCHTLHWYLRFVRPLILADPEAREPRPSPWLVPMLSDPGRPCPYETFHGWFTRIMRDVVKVPCRPHNYRHGQASLLYHRYPERIGWIAQRLGDTQDTVLENYAWVHQEKAMAAGQRLISDLIDI